ncbi:MAG: extracellular solute-binding protein [Candidatus Paceibacterota bacterium]|jgi:multiple sugar transport system substrate-binding protein
MTPRQKTILRIVIGIFICFIILVIFLRRQVPKPVSLEIWGIIDEPTVFAPLINGFQENNRNISVHYVQKDSATYQNDLLKAFADNKAPDIFMLFGNWLPSYQDKIEPLDLKSNKDLNSLIISQTFPQVVQDNLINNDFLLGIPLYIDTLALYYNKDIFDYYNIALPPKTWDEVVKLIPKLRKTNSQGQITRAAIALGTSNNIDWASDILSEFMMQLGSSMVDKTYQKVTFNESITQNGSKIIPGAEALKYYTQFTNPKSPLYTWESGFPNSVSAFSQGKTAMIIDYNQAQNAIQKEAPGLRYGVAPFPLFSSKINYARTMNLVVFNRSSYIKEAWQFLKYLSQSNNSQYYFLQTKNPPARLDLISLANNDSQAGVFANQILTSRDWYQIDSQEISIIFNNMIESVILQNISPSQAISTAASKIELLWKQKLKNQ